MSDFGKHQTIEEYQRVALEHMARQMKAQGDWLVQIDGRLKNIGFWVTILAVMAAMGLCLVLAFAVLTAPVAY